jgi:hypothetical protein
MKNLFTLTMVILMTFGAFAQVPQKMSYQCVVRNASGVLVTNQAIGMRIGILQGSATGAAVYVETHTQTTNANGLVTIEIGGGTPVTGTFSGIDWSTGTYFIKTETDPTGGTNYTITITSQLLSVPYALYSKTTRNVFSNDLLVNGLTVGRGNGAVSSNSAVGYQALYANTAGMYNTAYGNQALYSNTIGFNNIAFGAGALYLNTEGYRNTAIGTGALYQNTGQNNTAIGDRALNLNTIGYSNVAVGVAALNKNTASSNLVAVGDSALFNNSIGAGNFEVFNTAIGSKSLFANTIGGYNTAVGYHALTSNSTGWANTATGYLALVSNNSEGNTAYGTEALRLNVTGSQNTAVGLDALYNNYSGYSNTAIGCRALSGTGGNQNSALGDQAGYSNRTGNNNVFLGSSAGYYESGSNKLFIDNQQRANESDARAKSLIYGVFDANPANQVLTINGNVGIRTLAPNFVLDVVGRGRISSDGSSTAGLWYSNIARTLNKAFIGMETDDIHVGFWGAGIAKFGLLMNVENGNVGIGTTPGSYKLYVAGTAYSTGGWAGSDARWKKNIKPIGNVLNDIILLEGVIYEWRKDEFPEIGFDSGSQIGLIAQDVEKVFPLLVKTDGKGYKAVSYEKLSVLLVEGIKEQQKQIEDLKALVNTLIANQTAKVNK